MEVYVAVFVTAIITSLVSSIVGAAVGAVVSKAKTVRKASDDARQEIKEMKELLEQNTKMTCRLAIYNDHFSTDEKLEAYDTYHKKGWNHQTKTYMDGVIGGDVDDYLERHRPKES